MSEIPQGQLSRAAVVGAAALKLGLGQLQNKARKTLGTDDDTALPDGLDEKSARQLFEALTKLRGTAIKLAQMLGMESGLLPDNLRVELEKSWHQVPPLNRVLVRKAIIEELGQPPDKLFSEFDSEAFAAASLGQVHAARLDDGTRVAVKIQYPGIHVAMQSDIKLLRKIAVGLPNKKMTGLSIEEIHARLSEELDYELEAENTQWFRDNIKIEGVVVPQVFYQRSSPRVLTTELLDGQHLEGWLAQGPSQALRDQVAQRLYDCFVHSVLDLRCLHADPNPGNFLFSDDGSVGLVDFGCTRKLTARFVENLPPLLQAFCDGNEEQLWAAYGDVGMVFGTRHPDSYEKILAPFARWLSLPFQQDVFDFGEFSDYTASGRQQIYNLSKMNDIEGIAEEFIFFDRTVYGLCKIFEKLQAKVRMRHHWGLS